ncbi:unnamed protein product [Staurois parvus]|uniref:Uncharacterized protein n=1 Tax=Staurois parvus TaxID=386267 RepID=A0ABN9CES6_9NEOB|nr:unnamed protein product [Staurois parvus]
MKKKRMKKKKKIQSFKRPTLPSMVKKKNRPIFIPPFYSWQKVSLQRAPLFLTVL